MTYCAENNPPRPPHPPRFKVVKKNPWRSWRLGGSVVENISAPPRLRVSSPYTRGTGPAANRGFVSSCLRGKSSPGFTLIELMVVISIIAILIAILVPVVVIAQQRAYINTTQADMSTIALALGEYHTDFNMYPNSTQASVKISPPGMYSGAIPAGAAYEYLAEALLGYLPGLYDGAPSSAVGASYGYTTGTLAETKGFSMLPYKRVYGPYMDIGAANLVMVANPTVATVRDYYFGDAFPPPSGNIFSPILYYSAEATPTTSNIFGVVPGQGIFDAPDDSAAGATPPTSAPAAGSPQAQFLALIGNKEMNNTIYPDDQIAGQHGYLLVSAGPDGVYFTGDDVVYGGP